MLPGSPLPSSVPSAISRAKLGKMYHLEWEKEGEPDSCPSTDGSMTAAVERERRDFTRWAEVQTSTLPHGFRHFH
jgi:hypothetical protein